MIDIDNFPLRPTRAEISIDNLLYNLENIKKKSQNKKICAVVKADAYGHSFHTINALEEAGVDYFAVAFLDEAIALRQKGITKTPILILGYSDENTIDYLIDFNITPTVFNIDFAKALSDKAVKKDKIVPIHVKVDTGMGRIGFNYKEVAEKIEELIKLPGIKVEGIFTHFATADEKDKSFTNKQLKRFNRVLEEIKRKGIEIPIRHAENSAAIIDFNDIDLNMVRPGIILYGLYPSDEVDHEFKLKPVMSLLTKITQIKDLYPGDSVGYGRRFIADKVTKVATLPLGYADGFSRILSGNDAQVLVNDNRCSILGNICMDQTVVNIDKVEEAELKDDVEIFGENIPVEELAQKLGTINYEVTSQINKRVPRVIKRGNQIIAIENQILS